MQGSRVSQTRHTSCAFGLFLSIRTPQETGAPAVLTWLPPLTQSLSPLPLLTPPLGGRESKDGVASEHLLLEGTAPNKRGMIGVQKYIPFMRKQTHQTL